MKDYIKWVFQIAIVVIINLIIPILFWQLGEYIIPQYFDEISSFLDFPLMVQHGIILSILYIIVIVLKPKTFLRSIFAILLYLVVIFMFYHGSSIFSLYIPLKDFALISFSIPELILLMDYSVLAIWILVILGIYLLKIVFEFIGYEEEEQEG